MKKFLSLKINSVFFIVFFFIVLLNPYSAFAQQNSFVSVVNPIRGEDFWDLKNQKIEDAFNGQRQILDGFQIPATWLIRFDALKSFEITDELKKRERDEKGLFLEITPTWADSSGVKYRTSSSWHSAGSAFLSGYEIDEREKLIDKAFEKYKETFGAFPKSVGAWWIDAYSISYMQQKYKISSVLIVADQYSTDNYQIWGQYWSTPYYPSKNNALHPAQSVESKIPVVVTQWAARDPVNGYGNGVIESTFSVQANDYIDYHDLKTNYFSSLINIYTKQEFNKFGQLVVGLENSYEWDKYKAEYENQIKVLSDKRDKKEIVIITLANFSNWYQENFPTISPSQIVLADDPLGSFKKVVWYMNPYYRVGWFLNRDGSAFRDIRQYIGGEEELCFKKRCDSVNFATFATRVLDEVSFGHKLVIDEGKITDFSLKKVGEKYVISYKNENSKERLIELLPRDIGIDGKISSIDSLILEATKQKVEQKVEQVPVKVGMFYFSPVNTFFDIVKFLVFLVLGCIIPGFFIVNKILGKDESVYKRFTLSTVIGFVFLALIFYVLGLLRLQFLVYGYLVLNSLLLIKNYKALIHFRFSWISKQDFLIIGIIVAGTLFQQMPSFKNGLIFPFGMGLWGPNTHDGMWHTSLINQLIKNIPPENPVFSGVGLVNYHYFYDLLVAATSYISGISVIDLVFRYYPLVFSLLLGLGTYFLVKTLFKETWKERDLKVATFLSLYFVYFAGSFGWIVEFIKFNKFGGESAFWANQSISFNLNPPFAISLLIVIAIIQIIPFGRLNFYSIASLAILIGSLVSFKAYAGVLILLALFLTGIIKRSLTYLVYFFSGLLLSISLFFSNFSIGERLILFSPFWFIHAMIDSPDRVGWSRLSLARIVGLETGNWFKYISTEIIGFLMFFLGNLGVRFIFLLSLFNLKNIFKSKELMFLFWILIFSISIPTFFIQAGNPWNTIQFIYYGLYIAALLAGVVIYSFFKKVGVISLALIIPLLIVTPINSWSTASGYLIYRPHARVSRLELEALSFLKNQPEGSILTYPYDQNLKKRFDEPWPLFVYDSTAYVSALSGKASFLEDLPQNEILLTDYKKRTVGSKDFFAGQNKESNDFLIKNKIRYIYIPKLYKIALDQSSISVDEIYENEEVLIYKVKSW